MKERKKGIAYAILTGVYLVINLILLYYHEPWRDEAQTWLIARDLPLWEIPAQMAYEGHPCLWHLLIWPLVRLGLPYDTQNILAFVIVGAAAAFLIYRTELPLYGKAAVACSPILTYYYPVIARSYCLIPILLFLLAYWYPSRSDRPWRYTLMIALLVQTHVVMVVTAFSMSMCFFVEICLRFYRDRQGKVCIRNMLSLLLPLGSAILLLLELANVEKSSEMVIMKTGVPETVFRMIKTTLAGIHEVYGVNGKVVFPVFLAGAALLLCLLAAYGGKAKYTVLVTLALTWCFQFWVYTMVYSYSMQRLLTIPLLVVWGMWVLKGESGGGKAEDRGRWRSRAAELIFCALCLVSLFHTVPSMLRDVRGPYSNGKEAAGFVRENIPAGAVVFTDNQPEVSAMFPYLDKREFIYVPNGVRFTFVTWDEHWEERTDYTVFREWLDTADAGDTPVYLISCTKRSNIEGSERFAEEFPLLYQSESDSIMGEDYRIYRLR